MSSKKCVLQVEGRVLQFYSKSKSDDVCLCRPDWRRYISNFHPVSLSYDGRVFPSVEHAFAHMKYKYASGEGPSFESGGPLDGKQIKSYHSRAGMRRYGCVLDVERFNRDKEGIMAELISRRAEVDVEFVNILKAAKGYYLLHFARGGGDWGGYKSKKDGKYYGKNNNENLIPVLSYFV